MPPLGLLTVAAMLPENYDVKLIDMAVQPLTIQDIIRADLVFVSAMQIQKQSFDKVVRMCNDCGVTIVAGGPYPSASCNEIKGIDHYIFNEAENTLPRFLRDYELGCPQKEYRDTGKPDITKTPPPRLDLINPGDYKCMALQFSRGCPFNCEFCDIIQMFGRVPRTKLPEQFIAEMELIYDAGFRGPLFVVDDNFIGNKAKVKALLHEIIKWQKERGYPLYLMTETSVDLAQDEELMDLMLEAGLGDVFLGIESPDPGTLADINKKQNIRIDLYESVKKIQSKGFEVMGGFIIGFDSDPENIFDLQVDFIQKAGIPQAMVGLLSVIPTTPLYARLAKEERILGLPTGDNLAVSLNFIPKIPAEKLIQGYKQVISTIYTPKNYFKRCMTFIKQLPESHIIWALRSQNRDKNFYKTGNHQVFRQTMAMVLLILSMTFSPYGLDFIKYLFKSLRYNRKYIICILALAFNGYHYFKMSKLVLES
jgi:radical SAM superfamily enzyme YgiQ (UPF0313 family)